MNGIFYRKLLERGPWQEFERNTARLLLNAGWTNPQIVGRSGDGGADVLATNKDGRLWLFQCKFSTRSAPSKESIDEVRKAGKLYSADSLAIVSSRTPTKSFFAELDRLKKQGLPLLHLGPDYLMQTAERVSDYSPSRLTLHEYQIEAFEKMREAILETGRALLVFATGLGKTVVLTKLASDLLNDQLLGEGRILVLAHTNSLVSQLLVSFWKELPKSIETHRYAEGERPSSYNGITFATVQSFVNVQEPPFFDLVIVDEAHHLGSPTYNTALLRLSPPKIIGVSATPWRSDGISIAHWVGTPVFSMGIKEGLEEGWLSDVQYKIMVDNLNWDAIRDESAFGYTVTELNKKLFIPMRDEEIAKKIVDTFMEEGRRTGLVFCPSKIHAKHFASVLRRFGLKAKSLTSDEDRITKFKRMSQFASGKLQFLCVVDIFNEGIDVPDVDFMVFMRVTHSRRIFVQQLGRGLRTSVNKRSVTVLDFAADVRRIHAALDLTTGQDDSAEDAIENLTPRHSTVSFSDRSLGRFFYEWIADVGNLQDLDDDDMVTLPFITDQDQLNFPQVG